MARRRARQGAGFGHAVVSRSHSSSRSRWICRPADQAEAQMKTPRALSISSAVGLALGVFGASAARADDCDLAASAAIAQAKVPHAATHVTNIAGASTRTEMIFTADKAYF